MKSAIGFTEPSPLAAIDRSLHGRHDVVRLHQGKTYFPPLHEPRPWGRADFELLAHEHAAPRGSEQLRTAIAAKVSAARGIRVEAADVVVTSGATHALAVSLRSVVEPGDEVLIPSPQWLFATGVVRNAGAVPIEVPVFLELGADPAFDFVSALEASLTPRTRALYFNNPNNPTGYRLDAASLAEVVSFAEDHDLWIVVDNAYEHFDFSAAGYIDLATVGEAAARTFSVHTFSKSYGLPGYRIGYVVPPPDLVETVVECVLHSVYSVATTSQFAAYDALSTPDEELAQRRALAADAWSAVDETLAVPHSTASGGLYTLLDLRAWPFGTQDFLARCSAAGVSLAPGEAFGPACSDYARLCYTAGPPAAVAAAVEAINEVWRAGV